MVITNIGAGSVDSCKEQVLAIESKWKKFGETLPGEDRTKCIRLVNAMARDILNDIDMYLLNYRGDDLQEKVSKWVGQFELAAGKYCRDQETYEKGRKNTKAAMNEVDLALKGSSLKEGAIKGPLRVDTLKKVWNCSKPAAFFDLVFNGEALRRDQEARSWKDEAEIDKDLLKNPYINYFGGRCIKTDFTDPTNLDLPHFQKDCRPDLSLREVEECVNHPRREIKPL